MKKYTSKLEKSAGYGIIITALLGAGWFVTKFSTAIIGFLTAGMNLVFGGAFLVALILLFRNSKIRTACWFGYQTLVSKAVGLFVTTNKLEIVKNYLKYLKDKSDELMDHITGFKADLISFKKDILKFEEEREDYAQKAHYYKTQGNQYKTEMNSSLARISRLSETIEKYKTMYNNELFLCKKFMKMYEVSAVVIDNLEYDIDLQVKEYEMSKKYHKAMKDGLGALGGDKDKKSMYEAAIDKMQEDISKKASEIDTFMNITTQIVNDADMKMSIEESKGAQMLEEWEKSGGFESLLTGMDTSRLQLDGMFEEEHTEMEKEKVMLTKEQPNKTSKYEELFS